jgi:hypothetical protein
MRHITICMLLVLCASFASAQQAGGIVVGGAGLTWTGSVAGTTGNACGPNGCTPYTTNVASGETVSLEVWGDSGAPFFIGVASGASNCLGVTGINGSFLLDSNVTLLTFGHLTSTISICNSGTAAFTGVAAFPVGTTFALQALTFAGGAASLSPAIIVTAI